MAMVDDDDWAPDSEVQAAPIRGGGRGGPPSGGGGGGSGNSARAAFRAIGELGKKLDEHSKLDREALKHIHDKLDEHGRSLTDIQVGAGRVEVAVEAMTSELRHQREIQRVEVQGEVTARVEKQKTERERLTGRTKVLLALIAVLGTVAGVLGKWIAG